MSGTSTDEEAKTEAQPEEPKQSEKPDTKKVDVKDSSKKDQAVRDAHYHENGVKADGTGGTPPESEQ